MTESNGLSHSLVVVAPREVTERLVAEGVASPLLRTSRTPENLWPAIVVASTASVVTVAITELTKAALRALGDSLRIWKHAREATGAKSGDLRVTVEISSTQRSEVIIGSRFDVDELEKALTDGGVRFL